MYHMLGWGERLPLLFPPTGLASLKCYRTVTTLCTPEATFHDTSVHKLTLPVGVPVQRELLTGKMYDTTTVDRLNDPF